jgi:predicted Rossmann-fold nucleotide-binding protein
MTRFTSAFVAFPGGFGTLDEIFEIVTLIQTDKLKPIPLILFGVEYWTPLVDWIKKDPLSHGLLQGSHADFWVLTDDVDVAFEVIKKHCMEPKE